MYNNGRLIDSLVKCVLPNDDKRVITFNLKNEPVTVPTSEEFDEIEKSSDICAFASPKTTQSEFGLGGFSFGDLYEESHPATKSLGSHLPLEDLKACFQGAERANIRSPKFPFSKV